MKKGFTLIEILIAILIMTLLVTMAVPLYEKTIEKSRIAEVRANLRRLYDAKMRLLDDMEQPQYKAAFFGFENLDFSFACEYPGEEDEKEGGDISTNPVHKTICNTKDFSYHLLPAGENNQNKVCARRLFGDYAGVMFMLEEDATQPGEITLLCQDISRQGFCDVFGMEATEDPNAWCE